MVNERVGGVEIQWSNGIVALIEENTTVCELKDSVDVFKE